MVTIWLYTMSVPLHSSREHTNEECWNTERCKYSGFRLDLVHFKATTPCYEGYGYLLLTLSGKDEEAYGRCCHYACVPSEKKRTRWFPHLGAYFQNPGTGIDFFLPDTFAVAPAGSWQ